MSQPSLHVLLLEAHPTVQKILQLRLRRGSLAAAMPCVVFGLVLHTVLLLFVPLAALAGYCVARHHVRAHLLAARG